MVLNPLSLLPDTSSPLLSFLSPMTFFLLSSSLLSTLDQVVTCLGSHGYERMQKLAQAIMF